jgi:hypothetical protein
LDLFALLLHEGLMRESELYAPIKAHFEAQGYEVKGEVGAADVMARRGAEPAVIIELKLAFSLTVFHQALERLKLVDDVYIAVMRPEGKAGLKRLKANVTLCRRLGLGLLTLRSRDLFVEQHCAPGPYTPRKNPRKAKGIIKAFDRLEGDPNAGGDHASRAGDGISARCVEMRALPGAGRAQKRGHRCKGCRCTLCNALDAQQCLRLV